MFKLPYMLPQKAYSVYPTRLAIKGERDEIIKKMGIIGWDIWNSDVFVCSDGAIHVSIRTSMPGDCSEFACSPHGLQNIDLEPGENVTCEIKEQVGMYENNLICHQS
jgi:hypothetical protein